MSDPVPEIARTDSIHIQGAPASRRGPGRFSVGLSVLALLTALYCLERIDSTRDRLDQVKDIARGVEAGNRVLNAEMQGLVTREEQLRQQLSRELKALSDTPTRLAELSASVEELRGRAEGPERAWSRAEAQFLLELADRRLALEHDVATAIVALESADARLAMTRDPSLNGVRQQIAKELQAMRAVRAPDRTGILARLASAEADATHLKVRGIVADERTHASEAPLPEGMFARALAIVRRALAGLVVVRQVDQKAGTVVTLDEQLVRRQHLKLLLYSASQAVVRHDGLAYRTSLSGARRWLGEFFDLTDPRAIEMLQEVTALEPIDVAPALPETGRALKLLQQRPPARGGQ